jgi:16S rRNA (uracil1498-N3)-methyltransferase
MDQRLRTSAAHVLVTDVEDPAPDEHTVHHLRRVLRVRDGDPVTWTDGVGSWRSGRWARSVLEAEGEIVHEPRREPVLTLVVAVPKGDRAEWLVQKCTEVGIDRIVLVEAARSVVRWQGERADRHVDRLRRIASEAAMQARRVWLPQIDGPRPASEGLAGAVVAEPGGRALCRADVAVAVGPEGGWTAEELALAPDRVALGPHVLRVETAAVVATTLMVAAREGRGHRSVSAQTTTADVCADTEDGGRW